eukprot:2674535-Pyramimonas_sp.AAC.2
MIKKWRKTQLAKLERCAGLSTNKQHAFLRAIKYLPIVILKTEGHKGHFIAGTCNLPMWPGTRAAGLCA